MNLCFHKLELPAGEDLAFTGHLSYSLGQSARIHLNSINLFKLTAAFTNTHSACNFKLPHQTFLICLLSVTVDLTKIDEQ